MENFSTFNSSKNRTVLSFSYAFSENEIFKKAKEELDETPEKVKKGLEAMKEHIRKNKIPTPVDDNYLLTFLRVKKFRHKDSFKALENFVSCLKAFHQKAGTLDSEALKTVFRKNIAGILPYRDLCGRPVYFYRYGISPEENLKMSQVSLASFVITSHLMNQPSSQTHGMSMIVNCNNISIQEVYDSIEYGMFLLRFLLRIPIRLKRIDFLNVSGLFRIVINAVKPFLPMKILSRVHLHGSETESLMEFYDRSTLPDEFGGTGGDFSNDHWIDQVDEATKRLNELKRKAVE